MTHRMSTIRGLHSARVTHMDCPTCGTSVLLDIQKFAHPAAHAGLPCPACGALVEVSRTDLEIKQDGIWTIPCSADHEDRAAQLERTALVLLRH
jgi:predicted RNA-binding Zn-ribbon protein involved in translation (DUF1610 family)